MGGGGKDGIVGGGKFDRRWGNVVKRMMWVFWLGHWRVWWGNVVKDGWVGRVRGMVGGEGGGRQGGTVLGLVRVGVV